MKDSSASDSLLAQILLIVQEVQVSISNFEGHIDETAAAIEALNRRIDVLVDSGFPNGDLKRHKNWHERREFPAWKRALLNMILK